MPLQDGLHNDSCFCWLQISSNRGSLKSLSPTFIARLSFKSRRSSSDSQPDSTTTSLPGSPAGPSPRRLQRATSSFKIGAIKAVRAVAPGCLGKTIATRKKGAEDHAQDYETLQITLYLMSAHRTVSTDAHLAINSVCLGRRSTWACCTAAWLCSMYLCPLCIILEVAAVPPHACFRTECCSRS